MDSAGELSYQNMWDEDRLDSSALDWFKIRKRLND